MASAEEILSVERLRREIGVPAGDAEVDALISDSRLVAIQYAEQTAGASLLDATKTLPGRLKSGLVTFYHRGVRTVSSVTYIDRATLASVEVVPAEYANDGSEWFIRHPSGCWPASLNKSYTIEFEAGVPVAGLGKYSALIGSMVILARELFNGVGISQRKKDVMNLLSSGTRRVAL